MPACVELLIPEVFHQLYQKIDVFLTSQFCILEKQEYSRHLSDLIRVGIGIGHPLHSVAIGSKSGKAGVKENLIYLHICIKERRIKEKSLKAI